MKNILAFVLLLAATTSMGQNAVFLTENGKVSFVSDAPLEVIRASSTKMKGAIDTTKNTVLFVIENFTFEGFNSPLQQEHFHENYMESKTYPRSVFSGKIIEKLHGENGKTQVVRAKGMLDIHGVKQERIIKASLTFNENTISLVSDFQVLLSDHQIRIPKVVSRKISTEINISVEAVLQPLHDRPSQ